MSYACHSDSDSTPRGQTTWSGRWGVGGGGGGGGEVGGSEGGKGGIGEGEEYTLR